MGRNALERAAARPAARAAVVAGVLLCATFGALSCSHMQGGAGRLETRRAHGEDPYVVEAAGDKVED